MGKKYSVEMFRWCVELLRFVRYPDFTNTGLTKKKYIMF